MCTCRFRKIIQVFCLTLYSLHIIFEIPIFGGYFPKIKIGICSEDLPGRNSRIKWLFSVIVIGKGNFEKKTLKS